jgi:hypothetical protein
MDNYKNDDIVAEDHVYPQPINVYKPLGFIEIKMAQTQSISGFETIWKVDDTTVLGVRIFGFSLQFF